MKTDNKIKACTRGIQSFFLLFDKLRNPAAKDNVAAFSELSCTLAGKDKQRLVVRVTALI